MNKLSLCGLALCVMSSAFAQTTTTTYTTPQTLTIGNCSATVTAITQNAATNTITVNAASCGTGTPTPSVALAISSPTYTINSGAAAPTVTWTPNAAAAGASCQLTQSSPAGITASVDPTSANRFVLSTPQTQGTYTFTPTCTLAGAAITPTPAYVTLTVSPASGGGGGPTGPCDATSYTASINGKTVQRQCSGSMVVYPGGTSYSGDFTDLGTVLGGSSWPLYKYAGGYSPTFAIQADHYVSLAFTPSSSGTIHFAVNLSYGDGGIISVSTQPGSLLAGSPGLVCSFSRNGSNSPYIGTSGANCPVVTGRTYYLNLADMDASGNNLCNGAINTCSVGNVSYALYTNQ